MNHGWPSSGPDPRTRSTGCEFRATLHILCQVDATASRQAGSGERKLMDSGNAPYSQRLETYYGNSWKRKWFCSWPWQRVIHMRLCNQQKLRACLLLHVFVHVCTDFRLQGS